MGRRPLVMASCCSTDSANGLQAKIEKNYISAKELGLLREDLLSPARSPTCCSPEDGWRCSTTLHLESRVPREYALRSIRLCETD
jgi:hypothetical protein